MTLKSMKKKKRSKSEIEKDCCYDDGGTYPYGISLHLNNDSIDLLDIKEMPKVGDDVMILAKATITGVHESEMRGSKKNRSIDIQIKELDIQPEKAEKTAEETIYGSN